VGGIYTVRATGGASDNALIFQRNIDVRGSGRDGALHWRWQMRRQREPVRQRQLFSSDPGRADDHSSGRARQTIAFTSRAPADASVGATYTVRAVGGASGHKGHLPHEVEVASSRARLCASPAWASALSTRTRLVDADYLPATEATQSFQGCQGVVQDGAQAVIEGV